MSLYRNNSYWPEVTLWVIVDEDSGGMTWDTSGWVQSNNFDRLKAAGHNVSLYQVSYARPYDVVRVEN